ncbi:MAG: carboxymuconolactone decarboxylase family protein [Planctomycetes bacterium]|nr:carboxymuconolactone decarboxylase family protein [Planctomycetota bacterium]
MTTNAERHYEQWPAETAAMRDAAPDLTRGFGSMFGKLMKEGALTVREKELIALGIGMAIRCEPCIYSHLEKAMAAGCTREEIVELAGVVVTMQGGPGYVYVPKLLQALDALEAAAAPS